jgi:iron complex outermembrane receptor protein
MTPAILATPRPRLLYLLLAATFAPLGANATEGTFELGTITVSATQADSAAGGEAAISAKQIERYNRDTVGAALVTLPGVSLSHNTRNEDIVSVRGFDVRQVPLFVDGIPVYVPYDGYVDFGRFTTFDLAEIRVAKGAASLLYGPNTLGGAINLVSRKPVKAFEGDVSVGFASGGESKLAANVGSNQGSWYLQAGVSYLDADSFPLSKDFRDLKAVPTDSSGKRENSYRRDQKLSLKLGITPNATDEFALGYVRQDGEKGNPVYTGNVAGGLRYWRWPYWDKESLYFIGNLALGQDHALKLRLYDDKYANSLLGYTNARYTTQLNNTSFPSAYDDGTRGMSLELTSHALRNHALRAAFHYKADRHRETNPNSVDKNFRDVTRSFAVEDSLTLAPAWRMRVGASREQRTTEEAFTYSRGDASKSNWLVELTRELAKDGETYASLARKSRFPTIKNRYSFGLGSALYNPDLRPESATHFEVGIKGSPWNGGKGQAALFHSRIEDLMQNVVVTAPGSCANGPTPGFTCNQLQNIGLARHRGVELSLEQSLTSSLTAGAGYTYLERRNLSNPAIPLTDTPRHKLFAHLGWTPSDTWELQGTLESEQVRQVSYGNAYTTLGGFVLLGAKGIWKPRRNTAIELGVANLTDENYALADGYPLPGRTWFANAKYSF